MKYLKPEKDIPFGETKPLRLGHRREYPPPPPLPGFKPTETVQKTHISSCHPIGYP